MHIQSQYSTSYTINDIEDVLLKQNTVMVPYNHQDRQTLSLEIKAHSVKTYEGDLREKVGIPLTVITKETVQAKEGITKTTKEITTNPRKKRDYKMTASSK